MWSWIFASAKKFPSPITCDLSIIFRMLYLYRTPGLLNYLLHMTMLSLFFLRFYLFILEREEGKEKERERNINVWLPSTCPLTGDLACNPGMCPDWESIGDPLIPRPALSPLSHSSQGWCHYF